MNDMVEDWEGEFSAPAIDVHWRRILAWIEGDFRGHGWAKTDRVLVIMTMFGVVESPQTDAGTALWTAGNSNIILNGLEGGRSFLEMQHPKEGPDQDALKAWNRLHDLIAERVTEIGAPKQKRQTNEEKEDSIRAIVKEAKELYKQMHSWKNVVTFLDAKHPDINIYERKLSGWRRDPRYK